MSPETILVTGGAGYIGSVVSAQLLERGYRVVIVDNFCHGHRAAIPAPSIVEELDIQDTERLAQVMRQYQVGAVMHFAAFIEVGESMRQPGRYFSNNTAGALSVLQAMVQAQVERFVFSSTAAVYGNPERTPITEEMELRPTNAYGESKLLVERMLPWFERIHGLRTARLRYFNASGNTPQRGEDHHPETHLIPLIMEAALGQRPQIAIYGEDYPTPDGTCIRDYVHVCDLASAHLLALEKLRECGNLLYNLGSGQGCSVRQVIEAVRQVSGRDFKVVSQERRPGDPAVLVASSAKIRRELGWKPRFESIEEIVASAWEWKVRHPQGYAAP